MATSWVADALCREHPDVRFFVRSLPAAEQARAICARCLVREECLRDALVSGYVDGIFGGMTADERRALGIDRRRRRAA